MSGFEFYNGQMRPLPDTATSDAPATNTVLPGIVSSVVPAEVHAAALNIDSRVTQSKLREHKSKPAVSDKPVNVVRLAKARLRVLDKEIARIRKLEKERDELRRLVAAAEQKRTLAPVRELTR